MKNIILLCLSMAALASFATVKKYTPSLTKFYSFNACLEPLPWMMSPWRYR